MKKIELLISLMLLLFGVNACQKDTFPLTMDMAIEKVEGVISQYPGRDWFASRDIIEPGTVLNYSLFGVIWDDPEMISQYVSPNFRAWLVMIAENSSIDSAEDCLHLFVDVDTGNYTQVWLKGRAIVEWGSTPDSRAKVTSREN